MSGELCLYDPWSDALINNTYTDNGADGNLTNGDFALTNAEPADCLGVTGTPAAG